MESYSRIRSVKLKRPTADHPLGFSVRGGHEHGTGIFVSSVSPRSIAHRQGLKIGDQILRVNGYPVSIAVHQECLALMRVRTSLSLKVRSVGMIPVREKPGEPLTWRLVEESPVPAPEGPPSRQHPPLGSRMSDTSSQPDSRTDFHGTESKVYINTDGHSGLGCCICKGPPERPGIFVQSTKSSGVAREAGLRPGDHILTCNGHSFLNIPFAEAVYHLKSSKQLSLAVIKGAASDLFPGESSGYNSSASSLNGEAHLSVSSETSSTSSPSEIIVVEQHELPKRLSMVTEDQAAEERALSRKSKSIVALDRNMEWDEVEQVWHSAEKESIIIEVKGEDQSSKIRNEEVRLHEERRRLEEEQRRLMEEALRLEEEKRQFEEEKRRSQQKTESPPSRSSSSSSNESHHITNHDLAGALTQEILKRTERRENQQLQSRDEAGSESGEGTGSGSGPSQKPATPFTAPADDAKRQQHEQLIEEFKKAHRKMFSQSLEEEGEEGAGGFAPREERASFRAKRIQKEVEHARKMVEQRVAGIVRQRQLRIQRQHQEVQETEREVSQHVIRKKTPPPPPPLPPSPTSENSRMPGPEVIDSRLNGFTKEAESPSSKSKNKSSVNIVENMEEEDRPESPSPDYSNSPSPTTERRRKENGTQKVVRLSAYPSIYSRPEPSRLDFLKESSGTGMTKEDHILQRELENALARCQVTRPAQKNEIKTSRNGQVTIQVGQNNNNNNGQRSHKTNGGILKNSSSHSGSESGSNSGHLKTISFGQF